MVVEELDVKYLIEWAKELASGKGNWNACEVIGGGTLEIIDENDFHALRREIREIGRILGEEGFTVTYPVNEGEPHIIAVYDTCGKEIEFAINLEVYRSGEYEIIACPR